MVQKAHYRLLVPKLDDRTGDREIRNIGGPQYVTATVKFGLISGVICLAGIALAQTSPPEQPSPLPAQSSNDARPRSSATRSAKYDVGSGAGDIGKGAAKGVGSAAKGTGKAAADLVTLHPINAATDLGKGAASTGKNVGVGAAKGTGKIARGTGKAIKHLF